MVFFLGFVFNRLRKDLVVVLLLIAHHAMLTLPVHALHTLQWTVQLFRTVVFFWKVNWNLTIRNPEINNFIINWFFLYFCDILCMCFQSRAVLQTGDQREGPSLRLFISKLRTSFISSLLNNSWNLSSCFLVKY